MPRRRFSIRSSKPRRISSKSLFDEKHSYTTFEHHVIFIALHCLLLALLVDDEPLEFLLRHLGIHDDLLVLDQIRHVVDEECRRSKNIIRILDMRPLGNVQAVQGVGADFQGNVNAGVESLEIQLVLRVVFGLGLVPDAAVREL